MQKAGVAERAEPRRWLTKKEGVRHLIHASFRHIVAQEDPFAINLLVHSAEKMLIDLLKHQRIDDPFSFEHLLVPEHKREFYAIYREPYNFLKHADKDHEGKLPVYGIVRANDVLLLGCVVRYQKLFGEMTAHMQHYLGYSMVVCPNLVRWDQIPQSSVPLQLFAELGELPRGEVLQTLRMAMDQNPNCSAERREDLADVIEASRTRAAA